MRIVDVFKARMEDVEITERDKTAEEIEAEKISIADNANAENAEIPEETDETGDTSPQINIMDSQTPPASTKKLRKRKSTEPSEHGSKRNKIVLSDSEPEESEENVFKTPLIPISEHVDTTNTTFSSSSSIPPPAIPTDVLRSIVENPSLQSEDFFNFLKMTAVSDLSSSFSGLPLAGSINSTAAAMILINNFVLHNLKMQKAHGYIAAHHQEETKKRKAAEEENVKLRAELERAKEIVKVKEASLQVVENLSVDLRKSVEELEEKNNSLQKKLMKM